jgi:hypothetical protein
LPAWWGATPQPLSSAGGAGATQVLLGTSQTNPFAQSALALHPDAQAPKAGSHT